MAFDWGSDSALARHFTSFAPIISAGSSHLARATQLSTGRRVVVKVLADLRSIEPARAIEVRSLSKLGSHPNVLTIYDAGTTDDGSIWLSVEEAAQSLDDRLHIQPLQPDEVHRVAAQIASALAEAHSFGIVHADVKPSNVLLTHSDDVRLADFESAIVIESLATIEVPRATLAYAAPEVLDGTLPTPASDVWGLGVTIWAAIHGRAPYGGGIQPQDAVTAAIMAGPPGWDPPQSFTGHLAQTLQPLISECCRAEPERRPSALEVSARLADGVVSRPAAPVRRPRNRVLAAAAVATSVVAATTAMFARDNWSLPALRSITVDTAGEKVDDTNDSQWCAKNRDVASAFADAFKGANASLDDLDGAASPGNRLSAALRSLADDIDAGLTPWRLLAATEPNLSGGVQVLDTDHVERLLIADLVLAGSGNDDRRLFVSVGEEPRSTDSMPADLREGVDFFAAVNNLNELYCDRSAATWANWSTMRDDFAHKLWPIGQTPYGDNLAGCTEQEVFGVWIRTLIELKPDALGSQFGNDTTADDFVALMQSPRVHEQVRSVAREEFDRFVDLMDGEHRDVVRNTALSNVQRATPVSPGGDSC